MSLLAVAPAIRAADLKLEAHLIWGTNDKQSPDPNHKPVGPKTLAKLQSVPVRWTNYFEVNRQQFDVPRGSSKKITMSKECEISVRNVGNSKVEITVFGKGKPVWQSTQPLPKGDCFVTGGNAPNFTGWFVLLRQVD